MVSQTQSAFGLTPIDPDGKSVDANIIPYYIPYTVSSNLFVGDPIVKTGGANTLTSLNGQAILGGYYPNITKTTAGSTNSSTGVIVEFQSIPLQFTGSSLYFQTGGTSTASDRICYVCDDPTQAFAIRDDGVVTLDETAVGQNANLIYTNTGDTTNFVSGAQLSSASVNTTNTLQLRILRCLGWVTNPIGSPYAIWMVKFNLHTELWNQTGIAA